MYSKHMTQYMQEISCKIVRIWIPCSPFWVSIKCAYRAHSVIYCLRELHRAPHSFCFQALQQYPSEIWLSILYMSSILSLSHYTTKYNLCQLLSTGHPLNISLFFDKDWTSLCFVTVTSCDGDADQHIIGGIRRCNISLCNCVGRESRVACCVGVSVCCHGKINSGWKANEKTSSKFVEFSLKRLLKRGEFRVNFMDCWCGTVYSFEIIRKTQD